MTNKDAFPTIEQSLKMIEDKLKIQKEKKGKNKDINLLKKKYSDDIHIEEFHPFFQFYGSNCVIYYKKQPVVHIFKNVGICFPTQIIQSNILNK